MKQSEETEQMWTFSDSKHYQMSISMKFLENHVKK